MNYVVKDLPEIKYDPDVKEKLEMESDNTVIDNKKKIKHTGKNIIVCGTRIEKGTSSYNPLIDNIKDTNTQEAYAGAQRFASVLGMKHCRSIGLILFVRFSKAIPKKDKTLARLKEILKSGISFKTVSDISCVKDSGQDWYEMDALICTFLRV